MDMDVGNRLMDSRERWTFLLLARACVSTVKSQDGFWYQCGCSEESMGQVMLSAATAHIVGNHLAF